MSKELHGEYSKGDLANQNLYRRIIAKALNVAPEEDVNITTTNNGYSPIATALATIGMLVIGGTLVIGTMAALGTFSKPQIPHVEHPAHPAIVSPADQEFTIRFYNKDDKLIHLQQKQD